MKALPKLLTTEERLTRLQFEDLRALAMEKKDFDIVCKKLGFNMLRSFYRKTALRAYDSAVLFGDIMPIELIPLQDKNDLKEMARKYANKKTGMDYCKVLHMFIKYMENDTSE